MWLDDVNAKFVCDLTFSMVIISLGHLKNFYLRTNPILLFLACWIKLWWFDLSDSHCCGSRSLECQRGVQCLPQDLPRAFRSNFGKSWILPWPGCCGWRTNGSIGTTAHVYVRKCQRRHWRHFWRVLQGHWWGVCQIHREGQGYRLLEVMTDLTLKTNIFSLWFQLIT